MSEWNKDISHVNDESTNLHRKFNSWQKWEKELSFRPVQSYVCDAIGNGSPQYEYVLILATTYIFRLMSYGTKTGVIRSY